MSVEGGGDQTSWGLADQNKGFGFFFSLLDLRYTDLINELILLGGWGGVITFAIATAIRPCSWSLPSHTTRTPKDVSRADLPFCLLLPRGELDLHSWSNEKSSEAFKPGSDII